MNKVEGNGYTLYHGDCLDILPTLPDESVDMVMADPPYGSTACAWDSIIPLKPMWQELKRIIKPRGAIVMTASQPFTTTLIHSNREWFKYCWVWVKTRPGGFVSAKLKPLKNHEDVCVFSGGTTANGSDLNMPYFPQGVKPGGLWNRPKKYAGSDGISYMRPSHAVTRNLDGEDYPRTVIEFSNPNNDVLHPTQKPIALMAYLIRTYTNEVATVLDFCMGSGTTGVACLLTNRRFIGIEKDDAYFKIAEQRMRNRGKCDKPTSNSGKRLGFFGKADA